MPALLFHLKRFDFHHHAHSLPRWRRIGRGGKGESRRFCGGSSATALVRSPTRSSLWFLLCRIAVAMGGAASVASAETPTRTFSVRKTPVTIASFWASASLSSLTMRLRCPPFILIAGGLSYRSVKISTIIAFLYIYLFTWIIYLCMYMKVWTNVCDSRWKLKCIGLFDGLRVRLDNRKWKGKEKGKMEGTKNCGMSSINFYWSFTWRLKNLKMQDVWTIFLIFNLFHILHVEFIRNYLRIFGGSNGR